MEYSSKSLKIILCITVKVELPLGLDEPQLIPRTGVSQHKDTAGRKETQGKYLDVLHVLYKKGNSC